MLEKLFLSVGAMKAGTTWLQHQLRNHPEICFTPEKEIHYFAAPEGDRAPMRLEDRVARYKRVVSNIRPERFSRGIRRNMIWYSRRYLHPKVSDKWYENLFQHAEPGQWCADFSNLYCLLDHNGWQRVRGVAETIRAVYTLRHPLERMWSQIVFFHEFSGKNADLGSWSRRDFEGFFDTGDEAAHFDYAENVARLQDSLSEAELRIQFFEDQRARPAAELNAIERFLGIAERDLDTARLERKVNASGGPARPPAFADFAAPIHDEQVRKLKALGLALPDSWASAVSAQY